MNSVKILRNDETSSVAKVFGPCHSRAHHHETSNEYHGT